MRALLILAALLIPVPSFASSDLIVAYCKTTPDPRECVRGFINEQWAAQQQSALDLQQRQLDAQLEQARLQANGMALFGAGNALINGMNQGFQSMQQPYVNTPYFSYSPRTK